MDRSEGIAPQALERGAFPQTRWTIVAAAQGGPDESARRRALEELCETYWYPLYGYLRRKGSSPEDAEDLTQGFFAHLLEGDRLQLLSGEKGLLRSYLLRAIKNYATTQRERGSAKKRGGGTIPISIDAAVAEERYALEPSHDDDPERLYEMGWALTLLDRALNRVRGDYAKGDKLDVFEALKGSIASGGDGDGSAEIAATLGITTGAVHVALHRLRKRYRLALEAEIADTVTDEGEIEDEINHLYRVFGGTAPGR